MARTFTSIVELQGAMEQCCTVAIQNACEILLAELQRLIRSEFYDQYTPSQYDRTDQFFNSAVKEMVTDLCGRVFMDAGRMNYLEPHWTGETQLESANRGLHGGYIKREGRYWDSFMEYCNANALNILKQELRKQGLNVR